MAQFHDETLRHWGDACLALRGLLALLVVALIQSGAGATESGARSLDFCDDWRFSNGDHAHAESVEFSDNDWTTVFLPHDWAIGGPFNAQEGGYAGKLPWRGVGWYRKHFNLNLHPGDRAYLDFDGVMAFPEVYVNGQLAGSWDYGYTSFRVDATPFVNLQGDNVVAVRVDTTRHGTRWYPGAGIYRKVTLEVRNPVHFAQWATHATTEENADDSATVNVKTTVENHSDSPVEAVVNFQLHHPDPTRSMLAASEAAKVVLPPQGRKRVVAALQVANPIRWDVDDPRMYQLRAALQQKAADGSRDEAPLDQAVVPVGIRSFKFTADDGFHLNGRRVQLQGVNLHHDHGPLGAAFNVRAMERQLEIMKDMGANAIRTSHNAPAPELLDLCDRMGLLVWDECFDKWNDTADRVDDQPSHEAHARRHLRSMVMRDRNHPSIVIWSIGNEIKAGGDGVTADRVKMMREVVRTYDTTRPVGIACHIPEQVEAQVLDALDVTGWNYRRQYLPQHTRHPDRPVVYSESASTVSTRGFFELPIPDNKTDYSTLHQVDSYDLNAAPWADLPDIEFRRMERDRYVAGEFVWTGFDYLGEPTPFDDEAKSSYFGIVDLCGIPKSRYWLYRSHWRPEEPTVHIVPHWNWPAHLGQPVPVFVYTNGDSAELFLNGRSLGRRRKGEGPAQPVNFARQAVSSASSEQPSHRAAAAADGENFSRWCAASPTTGEWLQFDLGQARSLKCVLIEFERETKTYGYALKASDDGVDWRTVATHEARDQPQWGGARSATHRLDAQARFVRIEFNELRDGSWPSIREFGAFPDMAESTYYAPTYDYRLRWNDVIYEPGELHAVAYHGGKRIGDATVRTAGAPAAIRLTPDRAQLSASGSDLAYVLVEAVDSEGTPCPLAENLIEFALEGPADIAGVGNGNPLSLEPFQADRCKLFHGKAMLIVKTKRGQGGEIRIAASSDDLLAARATCHADISASTR